MTELVPTTTWSGKRRHWALAEKLRDDADGGQWGEPLCSGTGMDTVYDQRAVDAMVRRYGITSVTPIVDLPPCKRCARYDLLQT